MNDRLIVKGKTTLSESISQSNDILAYYGIPEFVDEVSKHNRTNMLNNLECGAVILDALNQMSNSREFVIEIPTELRQMLMMEKLILMILIRVQVIILLIFVLMVKRNKRSSLCK